jgi:hypothetical protein
LQFPSKYIFKRNWERINDFQKELMWVTLSILFESYSAAVQVHNEVGETTLQVRIGCPELGVVVVPQEAS